ncbi:hypothetical protein KFL_010420010 [Klebsormidium nitens]|uniref:Uncharacterized protein n=1 Tax=Klebsormidium nitens TaxID=105231 RepID=A0A1Y1IR56_KLENI|nr:hypothetical protein KFL_010420010 [Klebsormidium nitens]|eukprot:GAQ92532.1 hypothetical protein KFL_010420010 [Klebsormidium nitens]
MSAGVRVRRATKAGPRVSLEKGIDRFETEGVVRTEAVQHGGLWEIATVKKTSIFGGQGAGRVERRIEMAVKKPQVVNKREEVKPVKYIGVALDSDNEEEEAHPVDKETPTETAEHGAMEAVGAAAEAVGTLVEGVEQGWR